MAWDQNQQYLIFCGEKRYDELTEYLMDAINNLTKTGVDFIALSANTPHIVFDTLQEKSSVPLVFKIPFLNSNIEIIVPTESEMEYINEKISSELERGIVKEETLKQFQQIIARMQRENNIEAIILGCTELPLLLNDDVSPVICMDTMKIHIQTIVDKIVE